MTDPDILLLRDLLNMGQTIVWMPGHSPLRRVLRVTEHPSVPGSFYAQFEDGGAVDVRDCQPHHFVQVTPIFAPLP